MGTMQRDSDVKNVIKKLCCSYGWCYVVLWSFDQQNAVFLSMQDAYYEDKYRGLLENLGQQVHMLGQGIIGQAAFTKNHQWISLEEHNRRQSSSSSICHMFLNDSELDYHFSSGIKTIAAIPVEPQGVLQFGSTKRITETVEFVNLTKRIFQETVHGGNVENLVGPTCSLACPTHAQSCFFSPTSEPMLLDHDHSDTWLRPNDQFSNCAIYVSDSTFVSCNGSRGPESWNSIPTQSNGQDLFNSLQDFNIPDDLIDKNQELISKNSLENGGNWIPVVNDSQLNLNSHKSNKHVFEGISGTSHDVPSAAKRSKTVNSIWEMNSLQAVLYKSEPGVWKDNSYGMNRLNVGSRARKEGEQSKATKKKAKPGTRPRPKDRQQILDRMAELRELIPNGDKMTIDCLLHRTIKHMLFLQSVITYAERIKQADEPKKYKQTDPSYNGATWAYEFENQMMGCPLIVEDLSTPGQMLIEMLCEECGFFLEMVHIIRGFGVVILKGVMEVHDKIWARFIVEAEAKRNVTRHEMFAALVQLLQATSFNVNEVHNKVIQEEKQLTVDYSQTLVQHPVSVPETDFCINL